MQASVVQETPSSQLIAVPVHVPATHRSADVHRLLSLQVFVLSVVKTHPVTESHVSSVQGLPSLHVKGTVPTHTPPAHASIFVQTLPSSHGAVLFACVHPLVGSQASVVQTLPSPQSTAAPAQVPPVH